MSMKINFSDVATKQADLNREIASLQGQRDGLNSTVAGRLRELAAIGRSVALKSTRDLDFEDRKLVMSNLYKWILYPFTIDSVAPGYSAEQYNIIVSYPSNFATPAKVFTGGQDRISSSTLSISDRDFAKQIRRQVAVVRRSIAEDSYREEKSARDEIAGRIAKLEQDLRFADLSLNRKAKSLARAEAYSRSHDNRR